MSNLLYNFYILKSRLQEMLSSEKHLHPERWALPHEMTPISYPDPYQPGLLLGIDEFGRTLQVRKQPKYSELGNVGIFAPPRSGKSIHFTTQLLTWPHSAIVNDPKGELFDLTAGYRKTLGEVYVFDVTGKGHQSNPLFGVTTEDAFYSIATQLLYKPNEGEGRSFTNRAINMLTPIFLAARMEQRSPFPYVRDIMRLGLRGVASRLHALSPLLSMQFLDMEYEKTDFSSKFLADSYSTLTSAIRPFLTETVVRSLDGNDFDIAALMRSKTPITVYLRWPERHLLALQPLIKMMWGTYIEELKATYDNYKGVGCYEVGLFVDEAGICPVPELKKHIATVNSRGMSFVLGYQDISQIDENYGIANRKTILNSIRSYIFFYQEDIDTLRIIAEKLGYRSGFAHSESEHGDSITTGSSEQKVYVITPPEIRRLKKHQVIIAHKLEDLRPFKSHQADYRRFPELMRRQAIKPPDIPTLPPCSLRSKGGSSPSSDASHLPGGSGAGLSRPLLTSAVRGGVL
jgi:type IV secretion system protein VirD4